MRLKYEDCLRKHQEFGVVESIHPPVVKIKGLPRIKPNEILIFENQTLGQALILEEHELEALLYTSDPVPVGTKATRSGDSLSIPANMEYLGKVIDPLGNFVINENNIEISSKIEYRHVDIPAPSISQRHQIKDPLLTGVSLVDLLLPLGQGQRQLVVGDRKTGKTSFLLSAIKNQVSLGNKAIYVAIGKQSSEIETIRQWLIEQQIMSSVTIVAASSQDSLSKIYLSPFSGMTLAEFYRDQGENVLLILDDLSAHAKFYREISLLAGRFPGRDSYPGDIFYTHARLLERAGNYFHDTKGSSAISCLPVAETTENDLTDYIVTNLIGITDGHLLFDSAEFIKGHRPAINPNLSVTRVGRQTQNLLHQDISQRLVTHISNYQQSQKFAHFGAELSEDSKDLLNKGELLYEFFNQDSGVIVPFPIQILIVGMIWSQLFSDGTITQPPTLTEYTQKLSQSYSQNSDFRSRVDQFTQLDDWPEFINQIRQFKDNLVKICKS